MSVIREVLAKLSLRKEMELEDETLGLSASAAEPVPDEDRHSDFEGQNDSPQSVLTDVGDLSEETEQRREDGSATDEVELESTSLTGTVKDIEKPASVAGSISDIPLS